ncbi:FlaA1/EpsC-like NDP-sugar epimerase [Natronobacillus azotifigens]|uniref:Polysaccharide biosynthesis protein n=1 Tax=Natronobacillus azotifigens TaxID=472978 RepID=A0A9J6R9S1_9BACI|nr:UDP-N-acetylglucosamine 4,6-dehydratase family protein [Natronobacillus azotifigens]MCZ0702110.1 polysaccharide biosynthesis protein [Natronobacillus azotifigens]
MNLYQNKSILILGGTGTIGKKLLSVLIEYQPKVIRIFSRDEYKQFELQQEMANFDNIRYLIGDIRDEKRLLMAMENIDYVFHLAAMKHVSACEYNPFEAVQTNITGTQNVIQTALRAGVEKVIFTSTDKAISPTNVYGATKLTAERLMSAAENQKGSKRTIFSSVRFGNVMGSRGSVIPLFKQQILDKQMLTVTDLNMIRYMMTPTQAVELILQANQLAKGGEVFVLKMPIVKLNDLVQVMIDLVTKKYHIKEEIKIREIGIRPGEKRYEELMTEDEAKVATELEHMYMLYPSLHAKPLSFKPAMIKVTQPFEQPTIEQETLRTWLKEEKLI